MSAAGALAITAGILAVPLIVGWIVVGIMYADADAVYRDGKLVTQYRWRVLFSLLTAASLALIVCWIICVWSTVQ